jgi:hypothetical protein
MGHCPAGSARCEFLCMDAFGEFVYTFASSLQPVQPMQANERCTKVRTSHLLLKVF